MAHETWVTVGTKYCEYIEMNVEMRELRLYPAETLPSRRPTVDYRVVGASLHRRNSLQYGRHSVRMGVQQPRCR